VSVSNILLYDYTLTISCVIQAAKASGGQAMVSTIREKGF